MGTNFYLMSKSKKLMRENFAVENDYGITDEEYEAKLIQQVDKAKLTTDKNIETRYGIGTIRNLSTSCKT